MPVQTMYQPGAQGAAPVAAPVIAPKVDPAARREIIKALANSNAGAPVRHPLQIASRLAQAAALRYNMDKASEAEAAQKDSMANFYADALRPRGEDPGVSGPARGVFEQGEAGQNAERQSMVEALRNSPEMMKAAQGQYFKQEFPDPVAPETYGQPTAGVGPDGKPAFFRAGNRGGTQPVTGYAPPPKEPKALVPGRDIPYPKDVADQRLALRKAGAMNVDVGQSEYGTIPPGYQLERDDQGNLSMSLITGGPADIEAAEAAAQDEARVAQQNVYADVVTTDIDRIFDTMKDADLPTTGLGGSFLSNVPGTAAHDVSKMLDTVKANAGFDRLQEMRNNSKTGGALGQVSEFENRLLQATIGNMEQSQTKEQFLFNLTRVKKIYSDVINKGIKPGDLSGGEYGAPALGQGPAVGSVEGGYTFMGGDPSKPDSWWKAE